MEDLIERITTYSKLGVSLHHIAILVDIQPSVFVDQIKDNVEIRDAIDKGRALRELAIKTALFNNIEKCVHQGIVLGLEGLSNEDKVLKEAIENYLKDLTK